MVKNLVYFLSLIAVGVTWVLLTSIAMIVAMSIKI